MFTLRSIKIPETEPPQWLRACTAQHEARLDSQPKSDCSQRSVTPAQGSELTYLIAHTPITHMLETERKFSITKGSRRGAAISKTGSDSKKCEHLGR